MMPQDQVQVWDRVQQDQPRVDAAAVQLPLFWVDDLELWYVQFEINFNSRNPFATTDAGMLSHVLTLPKGIAALL